MAAHLRSLPDCHQSGCTRPAVKELRNTYNAPMGVYCAKHAPEALRRAQQYEQRSQR
jgi:hypothetical protein